MRRLCGRSAIAAAPVSGERERKRRGGTGFRCIVAHEGERSGAQGGASVRAVCRRMRYVRQADTGARAPRPGEQHAWVHGSDAKRGALELGSQGWPVATHGPKFGPTMVEDAPIGWVRTSREKNKEEGEMGR
jgi:hypothetical protein